MLAATGATVAFAARAGKSSAASRAAPSAPPGDVRYLAELVPPVALPPVVLRDGEGAARPLAELVGQGAVLNFWATWCTPCVSEMPALARLAEALRPRGVRVIAASTDRGGAATVRAFFARTGIAGLEVWLDPGAAAALACGVRGVPTTLVLDRHARARARVEGALDWSAAALQAEVQRLAQAS